MLTAHQISKSYNIHPILDNISFTINPGDRIGLIGSNGSGKTTLLRILAGIDEPDVGVVTLSPLGLRLGYLSQGFEPDPSLSFGAAIAQIVGDISHAETKLEELAIALSSEPERLDLHIAYDNAIVTLNQITKTDPGHQKRILDALGLSTFAKDVKVNTLSGGQKTRLALALVLLTDPQLLLLDEPTNHLDIQILEWLEEWIISFKGAVLIVSHDRTFLDRTVNRILYLNSETHTTREYPGNYSNFIFQFQGERSKHESAYQDQVYEIRRMQQDIAKTKQQALKVELSTTSRQPGPRRIAKKVAKKARSRDRKLHRYLNSEERVEKPRQSWQMKFEFPDPDHQSQEILKLNNLTIGYQEHALLQKGISLTISSGARVALTGPNGCGKTTLLRTIAGQTKPISGYIKLGHSVVLGYMPQEQVSYDPTLTPLSLLQTFAPLNETEARSYLHYYLFSGDDALQQIHNLSFGERARLALAILVIQGSNFLLLDEPINHLDIPSRTQFEQALSQFDGTVLAVVHDRYFIRQFASELWLMSHHGIHREENLSS